MERHEIINTLSDGRYSDYLEIGVETGNTFNRVAIARKVAVDPYFKVPVSELNGRACAVTSDTFFASDNTQFDCAFIDGLHLYEQVRRDFMNAVGRIKPGGTIVIDDCYPSDELAALRDHTTCHHLKIERNHPDRNWMGDVYKLVVWINDFTDMSYSFVNDTMGIVVVWGERRARTPWIGDEQTISNLSYEAFKALQLPFGSLVDIAARVDGFRNPARPSLLRRIAGRLS